MRICISKSRSDKLSGFRVAGLALGLTTVFIRGMFINKLDILRKVSYSASKYFSYASPYPSTLTSPQRFASSTKSLLKTDWVQQAEALNSIPLNNSDSITAFT